MTRRSLLSPGAVLVALFIAFIVLFTVLKPADFGTATNARTIVFQQSVPALLAFSAILPLIAGEFDVSIGGTLGLAATFCAWAFGAGWPASAVITATIAVGIAIGAVNSFLVVNLRLQSFIATLGMSTVLQAGGYLVTGGNTLFAGIPKSFLSMAQADFLGVPRVAWYVVAVGVVLWGVLERTPFGRRLRASGSGRAAATLIGVNTRLHVRASLIISGGLAALAGLLQTADTGSAGPDLGVPLLLPAFAAAFLGATALRRQRFNVWGTILAVLLLSVGITGLTMLGAPYWVPYLFNGLALLVALSLAQIHTRAAA